ncbi:Lysophospholipid acyltransferase 2 [Geodia barretti]|uniref:Lysophospholipid acyltransferase 2 n=1 Tax=Geodia barretti TaxID=519541 RepID=A0AA35WU39_GEOBA|nr:Lysophospholipid acyltransferase 2 [Geodia barretti]
MSKFLVSVFFCAIYYVLIDYNSPLPIDSSMNIILQLLYFSLVSFVVRCRFYFVFLLNDSISNAAGLGFEGYDEQNRPKWGLASNIDILSIELSMNARNSLNSWNITSSRWIRRVVYERVSWSPTLASFLFSAWWHGFYPGYYLGFFTAGLGLMASKKMRRWCNPFFTSHGPVLKWTYHVATWVLTQAYMTYSCLAVSLVWFPAVWTFWSHHYFVPTVAPLLVLLLVPSRQSQRHKDSHDVNGDVKSGPSSDSNTKQD